MPLILPEAFERREGETSQAFEAARVYFDLGTNRSLAAAGRKLAKSIPLLKRWSAQWNWVERARAWDDIRVRELDAEVKKAMAAAALRVAAEWETRENVYRERLYQSHIRGLNKFDQMLAFPLATVTTETEEGPNGPVKRTTVRPAKWTFDTAHRLARAMFDLGRRAICNEGMLTGDEEEREEDWMIEDYAPPGAITAVLAPIPALPVPAIDEK